MKSCKVFVAGLVTVMLLQTGARCKGSPSQKPKDKNQPPAISCELTADHPHRSNTRNDHIDGKVNVVCRGGTVDTVVINARLERKRGGGGWEALPFAPGWKEHQTHSTVKPGEKANAVAGFLCSEIRAGDLFRTNGNGTATHKGKPISVTIKTVPNPAAGKELVC